MPEGGAGTVSGVVRDNVLMGLPEAVLAIVPAGIFKTSLPSWLCSRAVDCTIPLKSIIRVEPVSPVMLARVEELAPPPPPLPPPTGAAGVLV